MIALHPFGDPQTLSIATDPADPAVVLVTWKVGAPDDLTLLGIRLGVLPEDRVMLDGAIQYDDTDAAAVAQAPNVEDYLLEHISVQNPGCQAEVRDVGNLVEEGATVAFTCEKPLAEVALTATTLTDLHPAYRTLATGPDGQRAAYAQDTDTHTWSLEASGAPAGAPLPTAAGSAPPPASGGTDAALQIGLVLAVVALVAAAGVVVARAARARRQRRTTPARAHT